MENGRRKVGAPEMFDLAADPTESKDQAAKMLDNVRELPKKWDGWNKGNSKPTCGD